jgi:hypothetical protein
MTSLKQTSTGVNAEIEDETVTRQSASDRTELSAAEQTFLLAQYSSLREEVLKRIEIQHQLILGVLIALGSILTISAQGGASSILLFYSFLALFLALAWSQNDVRNRQITQFLSSNEEALLSDVSLGWEHARTSSRLWIFGSRKVFAARGIFVGSQLLTLLLFWLQLGSSNSALTQEDSLLLMVVVVVIVITVLIIGFPSRRSKRDASI